MKKVKRERLLSREQAEKEFRKHVDAIKKIRGFDSFAAKARIRVSDAPFGRDAVELQTSYSL